MDIHYHDHIPADAELRRIVERRADLLDTYLAGTIPSPIELDVFVDYDLRDDRYRVLLALKIDEQIILGHGERLMRSAAIIAAFQELRDELDTVLACRSATSTSSVRFATGTPSTQDDVAT